MQGHYENFYYDGDCEVIKTQIVQMFYSLVQINAWDECGENVCSIGEVIVTCGNNRRRRAADVRNPDRIVRRKRSNHMGLATEAGTTSSYDDLTTEATFTANTLIPFDFLTTKRESKYVAVHFGVNVTARGSTSPQQMTRTFRRLQRKLSREIQNNDITFRIQSDKCRDGYVLKIPTHSMIGICGE